jgi:ABC-type lipoprotein export system ATPase subunit
MSIKIYVKYVKNNRDFHTTKLNLPTSNLDSKNREIILDYLKKVSEKGVTVLISTHDWEAGAYGDTIWHMEQGAISL